ncbi:hypothetical protein TNCV_3191121 [Trichonephila clavipes]|nr:hypothetical protein TNCV_3191121 [Trichonephila clavipes]
MFVSCTQKQHMSSHQMQGACDDTEGNQATFVFLCPSRHGCHRHGARRRTTTRLKGQRGGAIPIPNFVLGALLPPRVFQGKPQ